LAADSLLAARPIEAASGHRQLLGIITLFTLGGTLFTLGGTFFTLGGTFFA
jgi:hypothetical protein